VNEGKEQDTKYKGGQMQHKGWPVYEEGKEHMLHKRWPS